MENPSLTFFLGLARKRSKAPKKRSACFWDRGNADNSMDLWGSAYLQNLSDACWVNVTAEKVLRRRDVKESNLLSQWLFETGESEQKIQASTLQADSHTPRTDPKDLGEDGCLMSESAWEEDVFGAQKHCWETCTQGAGPSYAGTNVQTGFGDQRRVIGKLPMNLGSIGMLPMAKSKLWLTRVSLSKSLQLYEAFLRTPNRHHSCSP